jgi:metal-responsive CopG/Arc/MetJ family transcriptional regulator
VLAGIDQLAGTKHSRSAVIERILRKYLREQAKAVAEARDLAILNDGADRLNQEAADVLDYQAADEQLH